MSIISGEDHIVTEISELKIDCYYTRDKMKFLYPRNTDYKNYLILSNNIYDVSIPISNIISVYSSKETLVANYKWNNNIITFTGKPVNKESISGKSDFGDYDILLKNVKNMRFKGEASNEDFPKYDDKSIILLKDGSEISVSGLKYFLFYYTTEGYAFGGTTVNKLEKKISFYRGNSTAVVDFGKINKIQFEKDYKILITLKSGKLINGNFKWYNDGKGFSGIFKNGYIFIRGDYIDSIKYGL